MKRGSRKYSKGGVLMVYSTQNSGEGGAEEADVPQKAPQKAAAPVQDLKTDVDSIKYSDLPENYFDDLLDLDFSGDDDLASEKETKVIEPKEIIEKREIKIVKCGMLIRAKLKLS
jgi:hypothetical protein